jgi:hypothetical protein
MRWLLILLTALHVLVGVFWAGSSFVAAAGAIKRLDRLAYWQILAGTVVLLAGGGLFAFVRPGGTPGLMLEIGAFCALVVVGLQITTLPAIWHLGTATEAEAIEMRGWALASQRINAVLLAVTVVCMAIWRYA